MEYEFLDEWVFELINDLGFNKFMRLRKQILPLIKQKTNKMLYTKNEMSDKLFKILPVEFFNSIKKINILLKELY